MRRDETKAIARWRQFAAEARSHWVPSAGGRLVRTDGDGLLIEFPGALQAAACAFELHAGMAPLNRGQAQDEALALRIGIHVDDILFDDVEAYGSGVNLAKRITTLAGPGQTLLSSAAREELADGLHGDIQDLGLRYVKHLEEPIRVFAANAPRALALSRAAGPPAVDAGELRPTLAVVPFESMPEDAAHDALGYAIADEIIAALSRHPALRVLSRASTGPLRRTVGSTAGLHALTGASYLLTGRLYPFGQRVRTSIELCELPSGEVIWAANLTADVAALFEGQDHLVPHVVASVSNRLLAHEASRVRSLPTDSLASYRLYLGATGLITSLVPAQFDKARELLDRLVERHPRQAVLAALRSNWHMFRILQGWTSDMSDEASRALAFADRALDLDAGLPEALVAKGIAQVFTARDFDAAGQCYQAALAANPQHPMAWARQSEVERVSGKPESARRSAAQALALSPLDPQRFVFESFAGSAALAAGAFADAEQHARASLRLNLLHAPAHRLLVAALGLAGQGEAARAAATNYLAVFPGARVSSGFSHATGAAAASTPFASALREAGVPP